jgi:putative oxidoreductase
MTIDNLLVGLLSRLASVGLAVTMLGAIGFVHLSAGFFAPAGIEFPLTLLGATTALAIAGAGRYSLDAVIARRLAAAPLLVDAATARVRTA